MNINRNKYPKGYYALQDTFAQKASKLCKVPLKDSYNENTRFYILLNTAYKENIDDLWKTFIDEIVEIQDPKKRIEKIYKYMNDITMPAKVKKYIGCFRYDYLEEKNTASLHFSNKDSLEISPLSTKNIQKRELELKELFNKLKKEPYGDNVKFRIFSWLNNFPPFSRLFPKEIFEDAPVKDYYRSNAVWGQFLDRNANLRDDLVDLMYKNIEKSTSCAELYESFPYKATEVIVPAKLLYKHFGLL